ncbi:MAG: hypothetical protein WCZ43_05815 [Proteiniphilum sp.]
MTTIVINEENLQGKRLLEYIRTLPYAAVIEERKQSFSEAVEECNAVPVSTFVGKLHRQIDEYFDKNA